MLFLLSYLQTPLPKPPLPPLACIASKALHHTKAFHLIWEQQQTSLLTHSSPTRGISYN